MKPILVVLLMAGTAVAQPGAEGPPPVYDEPPPMDPNIPLSTQPQPFRGRVTFVSTTDKRWDVRVDQNAACTTPCALYIEPRRFVTMHSRDPHPQRLSVGYLPSGDFIVNS